jgi:hypothetical protein
LTTKKLKRTLKNKVYNKTTETASAVFIFDFNIYNCTIFSNTFHWIATRNLFGVSLTNEPLYIGFLWKKSENNHLIVFDENGLIVLETLKLLRFLK